MKIAIASKLDFHRLYSVYRMIQIINDRWSSYSEHTVDRAKKVLFGRLEYEASLMRVVYGYQALLDSGALDNDSDVLDLSPKIQRALECSELTPINEYHEELGYVLCWKVPIDEPPIVANPITEVLNPANFYTHYSLMPAVDGSEAMA